MYPGKGTVVLIRPAQTFYERINIAQVTMGRSTRPILDTLGLPYYTLDNADTMARIVSGALTLCYVSRQPLALCMTPLLYGGKLA